MLFLLFATLASAAFSSNPCLAQAKKGQVGISAALQDFQLDFTVPIWAADRIVIAPSFGLVRASNLATDWTLGGTLRVYLSKEKLSRYLGTRYGALILSPKDRDSLTDHILGFFLGGEYFFDSRFSIGGELQLNFTFSDDLSNRFGHPGGTIINTATAIYATFYLK
jgi:hypothetical protein